MKIVWNDKDADIGYYECTLIIDDNDKYEISVRDFTCEYKQEEAQNNPIQWRRNHPYDYEVYYCCGYSMMQGFNKPITLEEVKLWAEDYLLNKIIDNYKNTISELKQLKKNAKQAQEIKNRRNIK